MELFYIVPIVQTVICFYNRFEHNSFDEIFIKNAIDHYNRYKCLFLKLYQFVSNYAISLYNKLYNESKFIEYKKLDKFNNFDTNKLRIEGKLESNNKLIDSMAWWIPIKKWRNNFRNKFMTRPETIIYVAITYISIIIQYIKKYNLRCNTKMQRRFFIYKKELM